MDITVKESQEGTFGIFEDIDLALRLRSHFRIYPKAVGTLPYSMQNKILGPPFILNIFQLRYLNDIGQISGTFPCADEKYMVFKHFTDNHFTLLDGSKFGVDYLAYPGDPLYSHSTKMLKISQTLSTLSLIQLCRISNDTKKSLLICFKSSSSLTIKNIKWTTTGSR
jgi:hypothetical protein